MYTSRAMLFPMRYMGIDYGSKRVGVAFSLPSGTMAFPHSVVENSSDLIDTLVRLAEREGAEAVVMGHSHDLSGEENPIALRASACGRALGERLTIPVYFESEVYTTQGAAREQGRNTETDASAAALILDSYLTKKKHL